MASIPPPAPLLEPGFRLGRYELLCKIGQGGMATVWLARTQNSHGEERLVAIKTILAGLSSDDSLRSMLLDEARIVQGIDHPNVAKTLEVGQLWDMPYLVLEYVEGESVDQLCRTLAELELPVPAAIVVRVVADAALGLHEAHEMVGAEGDSLCIVHRDISPPNILVDEEGRARVIDFGVAKATERFTPETAVGVMKGRVPYMAPEHASGNAIDRRADIWSLGAVAYFMLAGRYPFDGSNDAARLIRILGTDPPDPLPDAVSPAVRDVIFRALAKDPDARYATASDLAAALEVCKMPATHKEVAQFFSETLTSSIKSRRALVEHALAAADARARAREMLDGPMQGSSMSYRPPPVVQHDTMAAGLGTLGTVTRSRSHRPPVRPWVPWVTATAIALIVLIAFVLGSATSRRQNQPPVGAGEPPPNGDATARLGTEANANAEATAKAKAETEAKAQATASAEAARVAANVEAKARAKAESEAAEVKLAAEAKAAEAKLAGENKATDATSAAAKTAETKAAEARFAEAKAAAKKAAEAKVASAKAARSAVRPVTKPPVPEDTIF